MVSSIQTRTPWEADVNTLDVFRVDGDMNTMLQNRDHHCRIGKLGVGPM